ncbi:MAG: NADH-quinone oxidoreductase subunit L [Cytophagaceae bacterium]|nr:NADH-quinone oxidoreductase subunit L [Cytophagaceae bacterium]
MLVLILLLPLAGFLVLSFLQKTDRRVGTWAGPLACALTTAGLALSVLLGTQNEENRPVTLDFNWFQLGDLPVRFGFYLDSLTATMLLLVHGIALLVQVYSLGYLEKEPAKTRYFAFLQFFVAAMLLLVVTDNWLVFYIGWELVGLVSYLLIGFWYRRPGAVQAAKKAFLINRIGDVALLLGIFGIFRETGSLNFSLFTLNFSLPTSLLLFGGVIGKSAQFPLHTWLPDAMEGPTPVSALLHAATMVAAGIFLLGRVQPGLAPDALVVVAGIGAITTVLGAVYALAQTDIKKVLAYSTISQLGLMVLAMGTGARDAALFHLLTHAFFKAGLFLAVGSVIHALHHEQNMRRMGGLRHKLPLTFAGYVVCAAALAGLPLTSGFLSKDAIIAAAFGWAGAQANPLGYLVPGAALASVALTAAYLTRQGWLVFFGAYRQKAVPVEQVHEPPFSMKIPVLVLAMCSLGWVVWVNPFTPGEVPLWIEVGALLAVLGGGVGAYLNRNAEERSLATFDVFYQRFFVNTVLKVSQLSHRFDRRVVDRTVDLFGVISVVFAHVTGWVDRVLIDGVVNGIVRLAGVIGQLTRRLQGGQAQGYVVVAVLGLLLLVGWIVWV